MSNPEPPATLSIDRQLTHLRRAWVSLILGGALGLALLASSQPWQYALVAGGFAPPFMYAGLVVWGWVA